MSGPDIKSLPARRFGVKATPRRERRTEREQKLWEAAVDFVERTCPLLDIRDVNRTADKVFLSMRFVTNSKMQQ